MIPSTPIIIAIIHPYARFSAIHNQQLSVPSYREVAASLSFNFGRIQTDIFYAPFSLFTSSLAIFSYIFDVQVEKQSGPDISFLTVSALSNASIMYACLDCLPVYTKYSTYLNGICLNGMSTKRGAQRVSIVT